MEKELGIDLPPCQAVWGVIEHPGWAPPQQPMLPAAPHADGASHLAGRHAGGNSGAVTITAAAAGMFGDDVTLQYSTVVAELPNLIEGKALMLAPPDPESANEPPLLDAEAVALLQRPVAMGLREYLSHLASLGVIDLDQGQDEGYNKDPTPVRDAVHGDGSDVDARPFREVVASFIATYEYARFSAEMLTYEAFRQLMHDLATILRRMAPLDPTMLLHDDDDGYSDDYGGEYGESEHGGSYGDLEGDGRSYRSSYSATYYADGEQDTRQAQGRKRFSARGGLAPVRSKSTQSGRSAESGSTASSGSGSQKSSGTSRRLRRRARSISPALPTAASPSQRTGQTTAPRVRREAAPGSRQSESRSSSGNSFAQTRRPYAVSSQPSSASLRSAASSGSVIRLADRAEQQSQGLPYVIQTPSSSSRPDQQLF